MGTEEGEDTIMWLVVVDCQDVVTFYGRKR